MRYPTTPALLFLALAASGCDTPGSADGRAASFSVERATPTALAAPAELRPLAPPSLARAAGPPLAPSPSVLADLARALAPDPPAVTEPADPCAGAALWLAAPGAPADLTPPDLAPFDHFAMRVALSGPWLAAGAHGTDSSPYDGGAVHLFRRTAAGWLPAARLYPTPAIAGAHFGWELDLHRDRLAVAAPGAAVSGQPSAGLVAIYALPTPDGPWVPVQHVTSSAPVAAGRFGDALRLGPDGLVVGAPGEHDDRGAAYVFGRDALGALVPLARLVAPTRDPAAEFGAAVAEDAGLVVVGAPGHREGDGAAWVFARRSYGYDLAAPLVPPAIAPGARFGAAVAIARGIVLIGADADAPQGLSEAGAVWVFEHRAGAWRALTRLTDLAPAPDGHFGATVRFDGAVAAVGAYDADGARPQSGAVALFAPTAKGDWTRLVRFVDPAGAPGDRFGVGVGFAEGVAAIGAWSHDGVAMDAGRLLVFEAAACAGPRTGDGRRDTAP